MSTDDLTPDVEGWLGQIIHEGRWVDYARGYEAESRAWQAEKPDHRRLVHWITRVVLVGHQRVCQGCGIGCDDEREVCTSCARQIVRPDDDRWQTETDDDIRMGHQAHLKHYL